VHDISLNSTFASWRGKRGGGEEGITSERIHKGRKISCKSNLKKGRSYKQRGEQEKRKERAPYGKKGPSWISRAGSGEEGTGALERRDRLSIFSGEGLTPRPQGRKSTARGNLFKLMILKS